MTVTRAPEAQKQALVSIQRFRARELEAEVSGIQARL